MMENLRYQRSVIETGRAEGREEGRVEERELQQKKQEQERISNIKNMRSLGQPDELISKFLQLPLEYVQQH